MNLRSSILVRIGLLTATAACGMVIAQPVRDTRMPWTDLKRVEQGVADQSPLDAAMRIAPVDMKVPNDFSGVYAIAKTADSRYAGWYARVGGGVIAAFPRSVYDYTKEGRVAPIPADTHFFIGGVPKNLPAPTGISESAVNARVDSRVADNGWSRSITSAPAATDRKTPESTTPEYQLQPWRDLTNRLCNDDAYRGSRIAALLEHAAASDKAAAASAEKPKP